MSRCERAFDCYAQCLQLNAAQTVRTAPGVLSVSDAVTPDGDADLVGTSVKGFRVMRHIAEGGMGHVYEAVTETGEHVALKVLHTALMSKPDVAFRFRREAELLASVKSEHVPRLIARGRDA